MESTTNKILSNVHPENKQYHFITREYKHWAPCTLQTQLKHPECQRQSWSSFSTAEIQMLALIKGCEHTLISKHKDVSQVRLTHVDEFRQYYYRHTSKRVECFGRARFRDFGHNPRHNPARFRWLFKRSCCEPQCSSPLRFAECPLLLPQLSDRQTKSSWALHPTHGPGHIRFLCLQEHPLCSGRNTVQRNLNSEQCYAVCRTPFVPSINTRFPGQRTNLI